MPVLSIRNSKLPDTEIFAIDVSNNDVHSRDIGKQLLSDAKIQQLQSVNTYFYATSDNYLVFKLRPTEEELSIPKFAASSTRRNPQVVAVSLWFNPGVGNFSFERDRYSQIVDLVGNTLRFKSLSEDASRIEFAVSPLLDANVNIFYSSIGKDRPDFGFMIVALGLIDQDGRNFSKFYAFKYTHNPILSQAPRLVENLRPQEQNVFRSLPYTFETLFIPKISGSFVYNFFETSERDFNLAQKRNFRNKSLNSIPKFVQLSWNASPKYVSFAQERHIERSVAAIRGRGGSSTKKNDGTTGRGDQTSAPTTADLSGIRTGINFVNKTSIDGTIITSDNSSAEGFLLTSRKTVNLLNSLFSTTNTLRIDRDDAVLPDSVNENVSNLIERVNTSLVPSISEIAQNSSYVGYIILKERIDAEDPTLSEPIDLFVITDPRQTNFTDTKIAYGETYRYKIRSVLKFVNNDNLPIYQETDSTKLYKSGSSVSFNGSIPFVSVFYFDSDFSEEFEISTIESTRPDAPEQLFLYPNSLKKHIMLNWRQKQQNKDVLGYNVYRKELDKEKFFTKINQTLIDKRNNFYIDSSIEVDVNYVYAVEAVDVHSNFSKLSSQFYIKISPQDIEFPSRCEEKQKIYKPIGLELNDDNQKPTREIIKFFKNFDVFVNPLFKNLNENLDYLLKITSLDTFEEKEIKLKFKTLLINHRRVQPLRDAPFLNEIERQSRELDRSDTDLSGVGGSARLLLNDGKLGTIFEP